MSDGKKHHYVPRSVLRGFAIPGTEQVHVFDKKSSRIYKSAIADAAAENHYNTFELDGNPVNAESDYNEHDTRLAELLQRLREAQELRCLSSADREQLAHAVAVQRLRVQLMRSTLSVLPKQLRKAFEDLGIEFSSDTVPDLDEDQIKATALRMVKDTKRLSDAILDKHWLLSVTTPEHPFWISDNPIVTVNVLPWGDAGFESRGVQIAWPISSTLVVSFLCPSISAKLETSEPSRAEMLRNSPTLQSDPNSVLFYNSLQVLQSSQYLYGMRDEFRHATRILEENPEARYIESSMECGQGQPSRRRMPQGQWLVINGGRTHYCCGVESCVTRDNKLFVRVNPQSTDTLREAIADSPHLSIELFEDSSYRRMREMTLTAVPGEARTVAISLFGLPLLWFQTNMVESNWLIDRCRSSQSDQPDGGNFRSVFA